MSETQDARSWFSAAANKRVTAVEMAAILDVSRNTMNTRLTKGLDADDLIALSRGLGISPIDALVELGKLTHAEVFAFLDGDGTLLAAASPERLIYQLAEESLPASDRIALGATAKALTDRRDDLAARRSQPSEYEPERSIQSDADVQGERYVAKTGEPEPEMGDDGYHDGP